MTASPEVLGYEASAQKLILKALESGDGEMLRCVKELMDFTQAEVAAGAAREAALTQRLDDCAVMNGNLVAHNNTLADEVAALREAGSTLVHLLGRFNGNACDDEITNALLAWQRAARAEAATK